MSKRDLKRAQIITGAMTLPGAPFHAVGSGAACLLF